MPLPAAKTTGECSGQGVTRAVKRTRNSRNAVRQRRRMVRKRVRPDPLTKRREEAIGISFLFTKGSPTCYTKHAGITAHDALLKAAKLSEGVMLCVQAAKDGLALAQSKLLQ